MGVIDQKRNYDLLIWSYWTTKKYFKTYELPSCGFCDCMTVLEGLDSLKPEESNCKDERLVMEPQFKPGTSDQIPCNPISAWERFFWVLVVCHHATNSR